jgi:hypothetical protein
MALAGVSLLFLVLLTGGSARGRHPGNIPESTASALTIALTRSESKVGVAAYYGHATRRRAHVVVSAPATTPRAGAATSPSPVRRSTGLTHWLGAATSSR